MSAIMPGRSLGTGLLLYRLRIILILLQFSLGGLFGGHPILGHLRPGAPHNGIENKRTKIIVAPVAVKVAPGKSKACLLYKTPSPRD